WSWGLRAKPGRLRRAVGPEAREVMESGGGGAQQEDAGGESCGGGERGAGHGGHEDDGPDGQRPADRTVAGDAHEMVEPEQQRSDRDGDGGQDPVAVACDDDDDGKDEGG